MTQSRVRSPLSMLRHDLRGALHAWKGFCELALEEHGKRPRETALLALAQQADDTIGSLPSEWGEGEEAAAALRQRLRGYLQQIPPLEGVSAPIQRSVERFRSLLGEMPGEKQ